MVMMLLVSGFIKKHIFQNNKILTINLEFKMKNEIFVLLIVVLVFFGVATSQKVEREELLEKRTLTSKTFLNSDNSYTTEISSGFVHYLDGSGKYQEINRNIVPSSTDYDFEVSEGMYQVFFKSDISQPNAVVCQTRGGAGINTQLWGMGYLDISTKEYQVLHKVQPTDAVTKGNEIYYTNVFENVDMRIQYSETKLKEEIFLTQKARASLPVPENFKMNSKQTYLVFIHKIDMDMPSIAPFAQKQSLKSKSEAYEGKDRIEFKDIKGDVKFYLPLDYAFLESDRDSVFSENITEITKRIIVENGERFLMAGVPLSWVENRTEGTIVFDPTVSIQPTTAAVGKDAMILEYPVNSECVYKNYGAYERIYAETSRPWRTLIQFDVSSIPESAQINEANLTLYLLKNASNSEASKTLYCYPILREWKEGSAANAVNSSAYDGVTWYERFWLNSVSVATANNAFNSNDPWDESLADWRTQGGDFGSLTVSKVITELAYHFCDVDIKDAVEGWVANPDDNFGIMLKTDELVTYATSSSASSATTYYEFWFVASDNTSYSSSYFPKLVIDYTLETRSTYYVRDAAGNVIATYER